MMENKIMPPLEISKGEALSLKTIGKHVNNALVEELSDFSVVAKFATTAADGKTYQYW